MAKTSYSFDQSKVNKGMYEIEQAIKSINNHWSEGNFLEDVELTKIGDHRIIYLKTEDELDEEARELIDENIECHSYSFTSEVDYSEENPKSVNKVMIALNKTAGLT